MTARALRDLAFLASALVTGTIAFGLLLGGWLAIGLLAITPLVVPALVAFSWCAALLATGDARIARDLAGSRAVAPPRPTARGFWRSGLVVISDLGFWRVQSWLLLRTIVGWPLAVGVVSLYASALALIAAPVYYRWGGPDAPFWKTDTLSRALLASLAGFALLAATALICRGLAAVWAMLADRLLRATMEGEMNRTMRRRALFVHAVLAVALNAVLVVIWATTGAGAFWPEWTLLVFGMLLACHAWVELLVERPDWRRPTWAMALQLGFSAILELYFVGIWACSGAGYFWPAWTLLALAIAAGIHWAVAVLQRVDRLEETRAGAVDVQEADLRRIERDLHDGAQARLVALGMSLGRAEQKLDADPPAAAALVAEARVGVEEALRELRDLARGIRPPVLADRGLAAAVGALADGSPLDVGVEARVEPRPASAVETAAYFVVAESLTNAAKHSHADRVEVRLVRRGDLLDVEIRDDGRGGADPAGGGLVGLRRRVEALDGTLTVTSPSGGPTLVRAELPCGS